MKQKCQDFFSDLKKFGVSHLKVSNLDITQENFDWIIKAISENSFPRVTLSLSDSCESLSDSSEKDLPFSDSPGGKDKLKEKLVLIGQQPWNSLSLKDFELDSEFTELLGKILNLHKVAFSDSCELNDRVIKLFENLPKGVEKVSISLSPPNIQKLFARQAEQSAKIDKESASLEKQYESLTQDEKKHFDDRCKKQFEKIDEKWGAQFTKIKNGFSSTTRAALFKDIIDSLQNDESLEGIEGGLFSQAIEKVLEKKLLLDKTTPEHIFLNLLKYLSYKTSSKKIEIKSSAIFIRKSLEQIISHLNPENTYQLNFSYFLNKKEQWEIVKKETHFEYTAADGRIATLVKTQNGWMITGITPKAAAQ